ncbi:hypothetical protein K449DRAFT_430513 [Hypoxylon sp. EC38]|nr:hypothetical protein K449DRAFT_430513 [Hypoxylon sp. EC38]
MKASLFIVSAVYGISCHAALGTRDTSGLKLSDIYGAIETDPQGFVHIGDDGVLRSYGRDEKVVDYARLSPEQLKRAIDSWPNKDEHAHLNEVWDGIDGRDVPHTEALDPPVHLKPRAAGISPNSPDREATEVVKQLENRQVVCLNIDCKTTESCQAMGCPVCGALDSMVKKICLMA